jgi:Icc-related predicted phosphoesterase
MKIVATSDTHYVPSMNGMQIPDGDVFIHAGDLMQNGYPDEWKSRVDWFASLPHKVKIYVPGNHDFHMQVYPGPALQNLRSAGVMCIGLPGNDHYAKYELPNGMILMGLPYVTGLPRWAFNIRQYELRGKMYDLWNYDKRVDVIVSHAPVRGILDLNHDNKHGGEHEYMFQLENAITNNRTPKIWISGHIHEGYGSTEFKGCRFYNVAMCNRQYVHANPPMEIEV